MKRNYGLFVMAFFRMLSLFGINIEIGQTDADELGTAIGAVVAAAGVVHDLWRRYEAKKRAARAQ